MAARSAYYAAFHAAEAFIIEKSGKIAKSHSGVRSEFARLSKDEPRLERSHATFLAQGYKHKEIGDYSIDPGTQITMADAEAAINAADVCLTRIAELLRE